MGHFSNDDRWSGSQNTLFWPKPNDFTNVITDVLILYQGSIRSALCLWNLKLATSGTLPVPLPLRSCLSLGCHFKASRVGVFACTYEQICRGFLDHRVFRNRLVQRRLETGVCTFHIKGQLASLFFGQLFRCLHAVQAYQPADDFSTILEVGCCHLVHRLNHLGEQRVQTIFGKHMQPKRIQERNEVFRRQEDL